MEQTPRRQQEIIIVVMGATGTGKSTLVNTASGGNLDVDDGLRSCTKDVAYSPVFEIAEGRKVVLIDTPGFDDTTRSDTDVLKLIASNLSVTYEAGMKLSGIIYMHRITDMRMGGSHRRHVSMFRNLCAAEGNETGAGNNALQNVIILTTMWDQLLDKAVGESRERGLKADEQFFKPLLDKGAQMVRYEGCGSTRKGKEREKDEVCEEVEDAARAHIHSIIQKIASNHPMPLQIQRELVDEKKRIEETSAGKRLFADLDLVISEHRRELEEVQKEMQEAMRTRDEVTHRELEEVKEELMKRLEEAMRGGDRLIEGFAQEKNAAQVKLERFLVEAETRVLEAEAKAREAQANLDRVKAEAEARVKEAEARAQEAIAREAEANAQRVEVEARAEAEEENALEDKFGNAFFSFFELLCEAGLRDSRLKRAAPS